MKRLLIVGVFALSACQTAPAPKTVIQVQRVEVPVAVKCGTDPGPDPVYSDSPEAIQSAPNLYERVRLLLAGRFEREARNAVLKASRAGCD